MSNGTGGGGGGGAAAADSSINGLKFGKKIYFEDVGIGVSAKSGGGSSSSSPAPPSADVVSGGSSAPPPRRGRGVLQGGQPPRCQVEGCRVDLSDAKAYYSRHKVCGMHSKSPKVVAAGQEQRFCQQCSRKNTKLQFYKRDLVNVREQKFHQLSEFDQGKRSCRRRLAGHNERRRKPQPGSLFSSRFGRFGASFQENSSRVGGFMVDFATYPRLLGRDVWPPVRPGNWSPTNQPPTTGKFLQNQWQGNLDNPPANNVFANMFHPPLQGSAGGGTVFSSSRIPPGECFAGVSDSSCALSLLSNQPWAPRNQSSGLSVNNLMNDEGVSMAQSTAPHGSAVTNYASNLWGYKSTDVGGTANQMPHDLGLGQVSQPVESHFPGEIEVAQQDNRQYMELGLSRAYGSTHQMHWSL
ncbi:hypothetical protein Scep_003646 [Stephania cephalantha]|uniref:SBP-type domain-containing protein n=1 Tax=Stephania cephalantha TaxID=152367 RepID=A0AAP0PUL0_9MAGN